MPNEVSLVYYIGAGASAKALPLVSDTPKRMKELAPDLRAGNYGAGQINRDALEELCDEMNRLADLAASCPSIDVLARRYYLQRQSKELRLLKATLSAFFVLEQSRRSADPRYGDFFAYMLDHDRFDNLAMPTDVRVITWNYDGQFEKSFADFFEYIDHRRAVGRMLQVTPATGTSSDYYDDIFSIYRINGAAGIRERPDQLLTHYFDAFVQDRPDLTAAVRLTLGFFQNVTSGNDKPYLQFAWEDDGRRADVLGHLGGFSPVDTVVVIGYSFPLFNRGIDRVVFDALQPKEVFLQVAGDDAVKDRLVGLGVEPHIIKVIRDQNQFHIPYSYSPSERMSWWAKRASPT